MANRPTLPCGAWIEDRGGDLYVVGPAAEDVPAGELARQLRAAGYPVRKVGPVIQVKPPERKIRAHRAHRAVLAQLDQLEADLRDSGWSMNERDDR